MLDSIHRMRRVQMQCDNPGTLSISLLLRWCGNINVTVAPNGKMADRTKSSAIPLHEKLAANAPRQVHLPLLRVLRRLRQRSN